MANLNGWTPKHTTDGSEAWEKSSKDLHAEVSRADGEIRGLIETTKDSVHRRGAFKILELGSIEEGQSLIDRLLKSLQIPLPNETGDIHPSARVAPAVSA